MFLFYQKYIIHCGVALNVHVYYKGLGNCFDKN